MNGCPWRIGHHKALRHHGWLHRHATYESQLLSTTKAALPNHGTALLLLLSHKRC